MKRFLSTLIIVILLIGMLPMTAIPAAAASSGKTGDCTWTMKGTTLTISGKGAMGDSWYKTESSWKKATKVIIKNGVTSIGYFSFMGCKKLTSVTIGKNVESIAFEFYFTTSEPMPSFSGCSSLKTFNVDAKNPYFSSKDGVLFNKKKTILYIYPQNKKVSSYTVPNSVTSIYDYAFENCKYLSSVKFGRKLKEIGSAAFYGCSKLKSVNIPDSVTIVGNNSFSDCKKLTTVKIGKKVKEMDLTYLEYGLGSRGCKNFWNCPALKSITVNKKNSYYSSAGNVIYNKKKTILYRCAPGYKGSVSIPNTVTKIDNSAFNGCALKSVKFGKKVKTIGSYAFEDCKNLTSIVIPNSVTTIGGSAFNGCKKLKSMTLPFVGEKLNGTENTYFGYIFNYYGNYGENNGKAIPSSLKKVTITKAKSIPQGAFVGCKYLTTVVIGDSTTTIGGFAFSECDRLKTIKLGKKVKTIGDQYYPAGNVFGGKSLTSITVDKKNPYFSSKDGVLFNKKKTKLICYPKAKSGAYKVPKSVIEIDDSAFIVCNKLTSVTISDNVKTIGANAFCNCKKLKKVTLGKSVQGIGYATFGGCTKLEYIKIPKSVKWFNFKAFSGCTGLKKVSYEGTKAQRKKISGCNAEYLNKEIANAKWVYNQK